MVQQGLPGLWFAGDAIAIAVEPRLVSGIALLDVVRTVLVGLGAVLVGRIGLRDRHQRRWRKRKPDSYQYWDDLGLHGVFPSVG